MGHSWEAVLGVARPVGGVRLLEKLVVQCADHGVDLFLPECQRPFQAGTPAASSSPPIATTVAT
ncbi:MAG: hypothetical protein KDA75_13655 [Planctomycetaceae bacterium]|nr:hypothetical protein [Planctomycetaceae bacterium]